MGKEAISAKLALALPLVASLFLISCGGGGGGSGNGKLTTAVSPANAGTVTRDPDQTVYPSGITVNLEAKAADGYVFKEWTGVVSGTEKTISVAMAGNMKVTAEFEKVNIEIVPKDGGTVSYEQKGTDATVTFTAKAADGYKFKEWTGAATGTENITNIATIGNMKVTAEFEKFDDLAMVSVQGGTFTMGCTPEQGGDCGGSERPPHSVTLDNFQIGKYEVTRGLWKRVMGNYPSNFEGDDLLPVDNVSWNGVQVFIAELNEQTKKKYRLPTEAEWEYAARGGNKSAGNKYSGSNNIDEVAWYDRNSGSRTQAVGTKSANELGIYDMSGNVWEWVSDWYGGYSSGAQTNPTGPSSGSIRVYRGGSWFGDAWYCRVSIRYGNGPDIRHENLGFRLVLSP
jgi:formylglycine-generating enzyme required for sulfatase activity